MRRVFKTLQRSLEKLSRYKELMEIVHYSVMKSEVVSFLKPDKSGQLLVDATTGEGGHSEWFLKNYPDLNIVCLDADIDIMDIAKKRLERYAGQVIFYNEWFNIFFKNYPSDLQRPDRILFDLGISTFHFEKAERGFSFRSNEQLDMRLERDLEISAADIVNSYPQKELANIIFEYGEEKYSRSIAEAIVKERKTGQIETSYELAEIIWNSVPASYRHGRIHPATRTFQSLRIAVNGELERLKEALKAAVSVLKVGGKIGVITFHSLEDRIVKHYFRDLARKCICSPETPICNCRGVKVAEVLTRKPVTPEKKEIEENHASRSSKLRILQKVNEL